MISSFSQNGKPEMAIDLFSQMGMRGAKFDSVSLSYALSASANLTKIDCIYNNAVMELMSGVRNQLTELIFGLAIQDMAPMSWGLSHSLSRYKLKLSAE
ncbi:putative nucleolar protein 5-2 [Glycine soja]|uniref:Putative nucleolar protein 5-2 n=1 Tax=Glycine soja TaxID=3848 RepID=A0A445FIH0_GLYSO|nr:putative nucleolar protein 5-2 [Glycine soja]